MEQKIDELENVEPHYDYRGDTRKDLFLQLQLRDLEIINLKKEIENKIRAGERIQKRFDDFVDSRNNEEEKWKKLNRLITDLMSDNQKLSEANKLKQQEIDELHNEVTELKAMNRLLKEELSDSKMGIESRSNVMIMEKLEELEEQIKLINESVKGAE